MIFITVSANEKADYSTITQALEAAGRYACQLPVTIHIYPGVYREKLVINRNMITLEGESADTTIITFDDYARMIMEDGTKRGTFRTQTVFVDANDFTARHLTFENSAGFGRKVGQALALYVDGDREVFDDCCMLGSQDTIFTGPLPPTAYQLGGFTGPKEFSPRINGRHYYHNCYIRGDVDFIFGSATAYFEKCTIFSQKTDDTPPADNVSEQTVYGYITAASTAEGQKYGYVFEKCRLDSDCPPESVYLGRPWRDYAKTVFINCEMGKHIKREGWNDWDKKEAHGLFYYAEYKSYGPGVSEGSRASYAHILTEGEAAEYTKIRTLSGTDNWTP